MPRPHLLVLPRDGGSRSALSRCRSFVDVKHRRLPALCPQRRPRASPPRVPARLSSLRPAFRGFRLPSSTGSLKLHMALSEESPVSQSVGSLTPWLPELMCRCSLFNKWHHAVCCLMSPLGFRLKPFHVASGEPMSLSPKSTGLLYVPDLMDG